MDNIDDKVFRQAVVYTLLFIFVVFWNWITYKASGQGQKSPMLKVVDLPGSLMESFDFRNDTLLSPHLQDKKWNSFKKYYIRYHKKLTNSHFEYYVVYTSTYSGLANKINGLLSSLLIAMVTNRGLLLDDWRSFDSYFNLHLANHHYNENSTMSKGSPLKIWRRCIEAKRLKKGIINKQFGDKNINVITNCPLFNSLAKNDLYYNAFVSRGLVRTAKKGDYKAISEEIYYRLLNFMSLEHTLKQKLLNVTTTWQDRYVVGMQIRVGIGNSAFVDNCKFLFMDDMDKFIHYAEYYTNRTELKPVWFISTDSPTVEDMFLKRYGDRTFILSDLPMKHTKVLAYSFKEPAVYRAILDNYLLSHSNLLITTAWSSFGEMALGRMKKGSTILVTRGDKIVNPPPVISFNREN